MSNKKYQSGMSLIELMIAMVLGLVLAGGAIQIFISSKATYGLENALSRLQETGRFVVDTLAKEVRMAGYMGCSSRGNITPSVLALETPPLTATSANGITGYNYNTGSDWNPDLPSYITSATGLNASVSNGSDVMIIQRASECGAYLTGNMTADNANVQVVNPNTCGFDQNDVVMITDCASSDVFAISSTPTSGSGQETLAHANNVNSDNKLSKIYGPDSFVATFFSEVFFIGTGASGEPALYEGSWDPAAAANYDLSELADGVEDMQILYGEDTGGGNEYADTYVTADSVADWTNVRSVRVNLLLRSEDGVTSAPRTINFNGGTKGGADRRLRMVYTSTITIRNRLP